MFTFNGLWVFLNHTGTVLLRKGSYIILLLDSIRLTITLFCRVNV